jgi:hypothetical protein
MAVSSLKKKGQEPLAHPVVPPFSDWNSDEICIDLANSDSHRLKGQYINTMGDLLGIVNHGLFIHAHVLLGKPISGKIEWCHCLENMKEVLQDPIILEHRFLSPGVRFCHVKKIPMVICWVRLPNDKPRQMTKFNNIYIYRERE